LFCDDSLERVPAVAMEGATRKKNTKKISVLSFLASLSSYELLLLLLVLKKKTKKSRRRKNARIKNKKAA